MPRANLYSYLSQPAMPELDPRHDAYIANAAPFAQPILEHLRSVVHEAYPAIEETIKWGMPNFTVNGAIVCNMAAFKQHCAFGLWRAAEFLGNDAPASTEERSGMGSYGKLRSIDDLPPRAVLVDHVRRLATARAEGPEKAARSRRSPVVGDGASTTRRSGGRGKLSPKHPVTVPDYVERALDTNARARATFDAFPPSHRREYVEWITEAKREVTRERRLAQMLEWLAEGKARNWKHERE